MRAIVGRQDDIIHEESRAAGFGILHANSVRRIVQVGDVKAENAVEVIDVCSSS